MFWDNWMRIIKVFVILSGFEIPIKELKLAVLYGSLGANAAHIASDFTHANSTYNDFLSRQIERFVERQSIINAAPILIADPNKQAMTFLILSPSSSN